MNTLGIIEQNGQQYRVVRTRMVSGTRHKFDGRIVFVLRRVSDGAWFTWLGNRGSKKVPYNARLSEHTMHAYLTGRFCADCGHEYRSGDATASGL